MDRRFITVVMGDQGFRNTMDSWVLIADWDKQTPCEYPI